MFPWILTSTLHTLKIDLSKPEPPSRIDTTIIEPTYIAF
jgi:hypothetical protein